MPARDPGVFLYMGDQILDGKIPYRDIWDHKPPLIFFINALGQLITRNSFWGIWTLEVVWLLASGVLGFLLLSKAFGYAAATIGSTIWIVQMGQLLALEGGNFTEEFAL